MPEFWESVINWDEKASERLERIGIKKTTRKQTRSLLAQTIQEISNDAEFEPVKPLRGKRKSRIISLILRK